jgi:fumarate hydratase class II
MKIANDLRWMNSGPLAGLGEIALPALQPGSSIMPGKVNPVIPEAVAMVAAQVIGNDATITIAGQSGNFQLNVMLPVIAHNLLQSLELLANASRVLADGDRRLHGQRAAARRGAGAQPDPRHRAEPGHRLREGRRDRQAAYAECMRSPR